MGEWILVSGAGTGIGRAIATRMAEEGRHILLLGRTEETLENTRASLSNPDQHKIIVADVRDPNSLRKGLLEAETGPLHGIIANAGVGGENQYGPEDRWNAIIDTNLTGVYYLVNEALPYLKLQRSQDFRHILITSSVLARLGVPGYAAYCASKAGLLGLMRVWAATFAAENILVNALCPGWVETEMAKEGLDSFARSSGQTYEDVKREQMAMVPLGKMSTPDEIAAFASFLLAGSQTSITGQVLDINNGSIMP